MVNRLQQSDLDRMVGSSGAIKDLIRFPRSPLDLPLHVVSARVDDVFETGLSESVARCVASGVSDGDPHTATAAAIGEAWERIAFVQQYDRLSQIPNITNFQESTENLFDLPFLLDQGIDRRLWAEEAISGPCKILEYREYLEDQAQQICEVPAWVATPGAQSTLFETTNGLACGHSFEVALDRAVREVVERDALMLVWLTQCAGTRVSPSLYLSPRQCGQIARLSDMGIQMRLRDISTGFGIKVFLSIIFSTFPNNRLGIAFGAGAHRLPYLAALHAFHEAGLSWRGIAWRAISGERPDRQNQIPTSFAQHAEYYSSWDKMHLLDFLLADDAIENAVPPVKMQMPTNDDDIGHVDLMLKQGQRVLVRDITPAEASDTGLVVVQALAPGLVPLYIGDRCADELALERLPTRIGDCIQDRLDHLNTEVHPWP